MHASVQERREVLGEDPGHPLHAAQDGAVQDHLGGSA